MILNIKQLFDQIGEQLSLDFSLDLSTVTRFGETLFAQPLAIKGKVENRAGVLTLTYQVDGVHVGRCDRCLSSIAEPFSRAFTHVIVEKLFDEDKAQLLLCADGLVDMTELVSADLLLDLSMKTLCREDCKGLCPLCGTNLNEKDCGCDTRQPDPRLDALRKLLLEESE